MKPHHTLLIALGALVPLWLRQVRFEKRLSNRQGRWEREAARSLEHHVEQVRSGFKDVNGAFERFVKEVNQALREYGRAAR